MLSRAMVFILVLILSGPAMADWPIYGEKYPVYCEVCDGLTLTATFKQPAEISGPGYTGLGFVTLEYNKTETKDRGSVGTPYNPSASGAVSREAIDVVYYIYDDIFPDDYTFGFNVGDEFLEFDFSSDQLVAARIHPELPIKLELPDGEVFGGGE